MDIKNKTFFHIHRISGHSPLWEEGNRINWVHKKNNLFYDAFCNNAITYDDGTGPLTLRKALHRFNQGSDRYQSDQIHKILKSCSKTINNQTIFIREVIFEEVRQNYFPHLPSRQSGIWVCSREATEQWWNRLKGKEQVILCLKLTGSMHIAERQHLWNDTQSHTDLKAQAFEYWTGPSGNTQEDEEILFEGIIDVIKKYSTLEEFKNN